MLPLPIGDLHPLNRSTKQKFLFYTGKGGVGKTTLACAMAVKLAEEGNKLLLISTDPASNLKDILDSKNGDVIKQHIKVSNLFMVNIDPENLLRNIEKEFLNH